MSKVFLIVLFFQQIIDIHSLERSLKTINLKSSNEDVIKFPSVKWNKDRFNISVEIKKPLNNIIVRKFKHFFCY